MNVDPRKFFIGLMDSFFILLSGALLTWLLMGEMGPVLQRGLLYPSRRCVGLGAFLVASYLFGRLVFLLGFRLDEFYDWARRYTLNAPITLLALCRRQPPRFALALICPVSSNS